MLNTTEPYFREVGERPGGERVEFRQVASCDLLEVWLDGLLVQQISGRDLRMGQAAIDWDKLTGSKK